ncbi:MAG: nucleoside 2-deoxyribosyltransferase [Pigmentiphaga sp.]|uniref:nucleoside 2-deoxyribosyltransferase n=1 Tax=Pigmentiphaga sp. TaxID=1977564 RepID=UPI003B565569
MRIYLAGPDVFRPDARAHGQRLKAACARHGHEGLFPLDEPVTHAASPDAARAIYRANLALLERADVVMANLAPFRGQEPDSGTAFEIGYAAARGKPVWAYADDTRPLAQRVATGTDAQGRPVDAGGHLVENFGLGLNLMLACSVTLVRGGPDDCLQAIAAAHAASPSHQESS